MKYKKIKHRNSYNFLITLFFVSFSILGIEITFTRLFSSLFIHNYVYILISFCIAGIGVGALLSFFIQEAKIKLFLLILFLLQIFVAFLLLVIVVITINLYITLFLSFLLFVIAGFIITFIYKNTQIQIGRIYLFDLVGGAIGIIISFFILNLVGAVHTFIIFNLLFAMSLVFFIHTMINLSRIKIFILLSGILPFILGFFLFNTTNITPAKNNKKEISWLLNKTKANIIETLSDSFGRCDLVNTKDPFTKIMYVDGSGGSFMIKWDEEAQKNKQLLRTLKYKYPAGPPINAFTMKNKQDALVIGSGGGIDVTLLLANNFSNIYAVEINPAFIKFVKEYKDFNGGIYTDNSKVKLFNMEGRSFVQNTNKKFNLILISKPLIESMRGLNSYALMENRLLTIEALTDYRNKLKDNGYFLTVTYFLPHLIRLTVNAMLAMNRQGITDGEVLQHLILVMREESPLLIMKKKQFTQEETLLFKNIFEKHLPQTPVFYPFSNINLNSPVMKNAGEDTKKFITILNAPVTGIPLFKRIAKEFSSKYNMNYTSDDKPYFFNITKGIPKTIFVLFFVSLSIVILLYLLFFKKVHSLGAYSIKYFVFFSLLGLCFIMIENSIIYKLSDLWNQKTLLLVIVISSILISSGIGGFFSTKIKSKKFKWLFVSFFIPLYVLLFSVFGKSIILATQKINIFWRIMVTLVMIFPLFFSMGIPFPSLLENISQRNSKQLFPWMLGINSIMTMFAGILTTILSIKIGFSITLLIGGALYLSFIFFALEKKKQ